MKICSQLFIRDAHLFYYLQATPSLFGGGSALAFFVAVGAWTWLETDYGWGPKVVSVILGAALIGSAALCFVLGGTSWDESTDPPQHVESNLSVQPLIPKILNPPTPHTTAGV
jgi:hypothetical protein